MSVLDLPNYASFIELAAAVNIGFAAWRYPREEISKYFEKRLSSKLKDFETDISETETYLLDNPNPENEKSLDAHKLIFKATLNRVAKFRHDVLPFFIAWINYTVVLSISMAYINTIYCIGLLWRMGAVAEPKLAVYLWQSQWSAYLLYLSFFTIAISSMLAVTTFSLLMRFMIISKLNSAKDTVKSVQKYMAEKSEAAVSQVSKEL